MYGRILKGPKIWECRVATRHSLILGRHYANVLLKPHER